MTTDCIPHQVALQGERKIKGVGEFGYHSWLIFCRDEGATLRATDETLKGFCRWRSRHAQTEGTCKKATAS